MFNSCYLKQGVVYFVYMSLGLLRSVFTFILCDFSIVMIYFVRKNRFTPMRISKIKQKGMTFSRAYMVSFYMGVYILKCQDRLL